jgi:hypothetical protein
VTIGRIPPPAVSLPQGFLLAGASANDVLVYRFSHGYTDTEKRGRVNPLFLDGEEVSRELHSIGMVAPHLGLLLLSLEHIFRSEGVTVGAFLQRLDCFLSVLPAGRRYAVGLRNDEFLLPDYFDCLQQHGVAHILVNGGTMPSLLDQILLPHVLTAAYAVVRVPARHDGGLFMGLRETVRRCREEERELFVYIDDSEETSALSFLTTVMHFLDDDLARLSPIRRQAA